MELVEVRNDVWGREVLLGVSWDLLWVVVSLTATAIVIHLVIMAFLRKEDRPSAEGPHLTRHVAVDRSFHWIMAISVFVLLFTGVLPIVGVDFNWLTIHWIAGLILTAAVLFHTMRALIWQKPKEMWVSARDFQEPFDDTIKPGKYSFLQKGMHHAMTVLVLLVIGSGLALFAVMDTPWWERSNALDEATLGWMFVLHGASTLGLIVLTALHVYFALRPEKRFYTRSMVSGWISEDEHRANHDPGRWSPDRSS
jgi:cytochrome b subunit of formate dehydrogenase